MSNPRVPLVGEEAPADGDTLIFDAASGRYKPGAGGGGGGGAYVTLRADPTAGMDTGGLNVSGAGLFGSASLLQRTAGDGTYTALTFTAKDSADALTSASWGIESVLGAAGDLVAKTGGVERVRVYGAIGVPSPITSVPNPTVSISTDAGQTANGLIVFSTPFFQTVSVAADATNGARLSLAEGNLGASANLFALPDGTARLALSNGVDFSSMSFDGSTLTVHSDTADALFVSSASGISILAQTSATDGSGGATFEARGNTAQTAPLFNFKGTDGTTVVASVAIDGTVDASAFSVASVPGASGTDSNGNVFVGGICTVVV